MRSRLLGLIVLACCLSVGVACASPIFSFTGTFSQDDHLEIFLFTAPSASFVAQTLSYASGTNGAGTAIPAGGFDPVLSLYNATGGLVASSTLVAMNDDGAGAATDPITGNAFDSYLAVSTLNAGDTYALILSEFDNVPVATGSPTWGDGFTQSGQGDFTAGEFGCPDGTPFCDAPYPQRTGSWAVDIAGARSASDITGGTPEPGSILLLSAGLASLALLRRRIKQI